jgi:hypothetical protein
MILAVVCFILATVISIILWQNTNSQGWRYKAGIVFGYLIVLAICSQYINLSKTLGEGGFFEGFEVQIPDLDDESGMAIINSPEYNDNNGFIDEAEREQLQENKVKSVNKIKSLGELDQLAKGGINVNVPEKANFQDTASGSNNGELRNAFNPQIIIYGDGKNDGSGTSGQSNSSLSLSNQQTSLNSSVSSVSSAVSSSTNNFNVAPRVIDEYLKPRSDIFSGGNNPTPGTDPFEWMTRFFNQNGGSHNSGDTASCPIEKPYAEEGRGRFNMATLTNRTYVPGMSYMPPTEWNVPQYHPTTCRQVCNNTFVDTRALPIGIMDPGTPIFALEIGSDGTIAKNERDVTLTNVGSIMPKFTYREYVDCPNVCQDDYMTTTTTRPVTTTTTRPVTSTMPMTSTTGYATTSTMPMTSTTGYATTSTSPMTSTTGYATTSTSPMTSTTGYATTSTTL